MLALIIITLCGWLGSKHYTNSMLVAACSGSPVSARRRWTLLFVVVVFCFCFAKHIFVGHLFRNMHPSITIYLSLFHAPLHHYSFTRHFLSDNWSWAESNFSHNTLFLILAQIRGWSTDWQIDYSSSSWMSVRPQRSLSRRRRPDRKLVVASSLLVSYNIYLKNKF